VQLFRKRNGAYRWSIARDLADPELWTERYRCPTWFDYLRQRNRATKSETATERQALAFHIGPGPVRVRRMLSVRSAPYARRITRSTTLPAQITAVWTERTRQSEPLRERQQSQQSPCPTGPS
jgi:hypothetical protein